MKPSFTISLLRFSLVLALIVLSAKQSFAQKDQANIVEVSGLVMNADSTETVFGVHIYDVRRGRGTVSDYRGWFSHAFYAGDTVIFSAIGFTNRTIVIPDDVGDKYTIIMALNEEITQLADVEINPFPSEEMFKEAILAMSLTDEQQSVLDNFQPDVVQRLMLTMPIEGSPDMNYRYLMDQQYNQLRYSSGPRTNPLLNPFAWAQFINSLKRKKK